MRNKIRSVGLIILAAIVMAAAAACVPTRPGDSGNGNNSNAGQTKPKELSVGDNAPDFTVNLLQGGEFTLSENRGKVVFLNIWATWCSPCVAEMPAIQELSEQYAEDVVFIGVNYAENAAKVGDFIAGRGFTYNIGLDERGEIARNLYPSSGIPYTLIIDAEGIITEIFLGGGAEMHAVFDEAMSAALNR